MRNWKYICLSLCSKYHIQSTYSRQCAGKSLEPLSNERSSPRAAGYLDKLLKGLFSNAIRVRVLGRTVVSKRLVSTSMAFKQVCFLAGEIRLSKDST